MSIKEIAKKSRSYRRFDNTQKISQETLIDIIDTTRYAPSARNGQTLKYIPVVDNSKCAEIYSTLKWAGYLTDWDGPIQAERPTAYIIIVHDKALGAYNAIDTGLCAELINLAANEKGLGCCLIGAYNKQELEHIIGISSESYDSVLVVALGRPVENIIIEPMKDNNIRYWRDENKTHHVPKREINSIIIKCAQ